MSIEKPIDQHFFEIESKILRKQSNRCIYFENQNINAKYAKY